MLVPIGHVVPHQLHGPRVVEVHGQQVPRVEQLGQWGETPCSNFARIFYYKPSILGVPPFVETIGNPLIINHILTITNHIIIV